VGLFSFGGGYAALPLIQNQVVTSNTWLTMGEFSDIITISQMTPGPIAINTATFVGTRVAGVFGAVISTFGCILPSCIIVLILAVLYKKYKNLRYVQGVLKSLQPAVVGMIAAAGLGIIINALWNGNAISLDIKSIDYVVAGLIVIFVVVLRKFKLSPSIVILGAGLVGGLIYSLI
jgi:chromate transporter